MFQDRRSAWMAIIPKSRLSCSYVQNETGLKTAGYVSPKTKGA